MRERCCYSRHVARLIEVDWFAIAASTVASGARSTVSKFQSCLPERLETKLLVERLVDVDGARVRAG